ncbi:hypothetical protein F0562_023119 [Nyssa sinensis]|uniref:Uncharacterized protein n=1 Tax=Nyssa sinensis TaxID=561372 RepID=A0A5J5BJI0_9ASTE|nr:hypothetical protein F0562_023119 [Nyssa sinensis]
MALSSWLCTSNTKNLLVKIVHPGGHVELHDRPVLAAEIMLRNPKCCVAHPNVFQQPWAIVAPDTTLSLEIQTSQSGSKDDGDDDGPVCCCRMLMKKTPRSCFCLKQSDHEKLERDANSSDNNCLPCLLTGMKMKGNSEDSSKESRSPSSSIGASETRRLTGKRTEDVTRKGESPRRSLSHFDHWQPKSREHP